jgi:hypothetical protein
MITLKMFYGTIPRERVAEWTPFCVHVGLPCEIAEMPFGRFSGSVLAKRDYARKQDAHGTFQGLLRLISVCSESLANDLGSERRTARSRPALRPRTRARPFRSGISEPLPSRTIRTGRAFGSNSAGFDGFIGLDKMTFSL